MKTGNFTHMMYTMLTGYETSAQTSKQTPEQARQNIWFDLM